MCSKLYDLPKRAPERPYHFRERLWRCPFDAVSDFGALDVCSESCNFGLQTILLSDRYVSLVVNITRR